MNRTIEAVLRVSAKTGNLQALGKVQRELSRVYSQAEQFNRRQSVMGRAQRAYWGEMTMLAGRFAGPLALGLAGYQMGKAASNMEDALFRIQKKTGATEAQLAKLRSEIKDLSRDVPVSLDEIAAAFERGGAAGIPLDDLKEFAELTVKVADSWDMTAESVANAFAGFEAGMGIPRKDLEGFADLINYLADSGIADESGIVDFIDRAGASLKNFGLQKEEIAAYGAAMLNLKIPAEVAARAMDTLTGKLIAPSNLSPKSRSALQEVVGDLGKYAKLVEKDAGGALDLFWGKLQRFSRADRARVLGGLLGEGFDDEVMRLSAGIEELNRNLDATADKSRYLGSISEASANKMKLWSSQVDIFKSNMTGLADTFGAPLLDKVNAGLKGVNEFFDAQADMSAGRAKATSLGETETQIFEEYRRRYQAAYGDEGGPGLGESYRRDLQALGSGDMRSLYERLGDVERQRGRDDVELAAARRFEGFDTRGQAIREAARPMPTPSWRPTTMSEADQRALYGQGQAIQFWGDADRRIRTNEIVESMKRGVVNPVGDLEARLEAAAKLPIDGIADRSRVAQGTDGGSIDRMLSGIDALAPAGEKAGQSIERGGTSAGDAIRQAGAESGTSLGQNAAAGIAQGGDQAAAALRQAIEQGAAAAAAAIRAALSQGVKVNVAGAGGSPAVSGVRGRTMPDAGKTPGQGE